MFDWEIITSGISEGAYVSGRSTTAEAGLESDYEQSMTSWVLGL